MNAWLVHVSEHQRDSDADCMDGSLSTNEWRDWVAPSSPIVFLSSHHRLTTIVPSRQYLRFDLCVCQPSVLSAADLCSMRSYEKNRKIPIKDAKIYRRTAGISWRLFIGLFRFFSTDRIQHKSIHFARVAGQLICIDRHAGLVGWLPAIGSVELGESRWSQEVNTLLVWQEKITEHLRIEIKDDVKFIHSLVQSILE